MKHRPLEITTLSVDVGFDDELNSAFNTLNSVRDGKLSHNNSHSHISFEAEIELRERPVRN